MYDAETLLQAPALVLCGVDSWYDDVVVVFVAMDAGRDRVVGVLEDSLNDVDTLFVQKTLHGLDDVHTQRWVLATITGAISQLKLRNSNFNWNCNSPKKKRSNFNCNFNCSLKKIHYITIIFQLFFNYI